MCHSLWKDENGAILLAELVLIASILVLGMLVAGLVELQSSIVQELGDFSNAFGNFNQSYTTSGFNSTKGVNQSKARTYGAKYTDHIEHLEEFCNEIDLVCTDPGEQAK